MKHRPSLPSLLPFALLSAGTFHDSGASHSLPVIYERKRVTSHGYAVWSSRGDGWWCG